MNRLGVWLFLFAACGKVSTSPEGAADAHALDAFACTATEQLCGSSCVDTATDMMNCGACGATCEAGLETCQAGECVGMVSTCANILATNSHATDGSYLLADGTTINCDFSNSTCAQIHTANGRAQSGPYTKMDGSTIYCDMDTGTTISGVSFGEVSVAYSGYRMLGLSDYQTPGTQQTFIHFFNAQAGSIPLIATWTLGNCCIKYDSSTNFLILGSAEGTNSYVEPGFCADPPLATGSISVFTTGGFVIESAPLPTTFFTTYPATDDATGDCDVNGNPAYFWQEAP
ncbi:MAG TPA: hypothetical protein VGL61_32130 [Kofleriaceae bacterium]|jgi:hypothetical protein